MNYLHVKYYISIIFDTYQSYLYTCIYIIIHCFEFQRPSFFIPEIFFVVQGQDFSLHRFALYDLHAIFYGVEYSEFKTHMGHYFVLSKNLSLGVFCVRFIFVYTHTATKDLFLYFSFVKEKEKEVRGSFAEYRRPTTKN